MRAAAARATVAVVAALVAGVAAAAPAGPTPRRPGQEGGPEGVVLTVDVGVAGFVAPGRPYPVTVTVTTDRLVDGVVEVVVPGLASATTLERPVEVTGGSTAKFTLIAPAVGDAVGGNVRARLSAADGVSATADVELRADLGQELVGVLPELTGSPGSLPGTVPLVVGVDGGTARLVPVEPDLLAEGPLALGPLDQVVASPGEVAGLDDTARAALAAWVDDGGLLILAGAGAQAGAGGGATGDGLPAGWWPGTGGAVRAGLGRVRSVTGDWQRSLVPSPTRSTAEEQIMASDLGGFVDLPMVARLGRDAGMGLPDGARLGLLLAIYVLVMGPGTYLVVRRFGRREVAWATLPVLALVATGAVFVTGASLRRAAEAAQVTVYEVGPGAAVATTWSLVPSSRGGEVGVELPGGWTGAAAYDELSGGAVAFDDMGNPMPTSADEGVRLAADGDGSRLTDDVAPGGYALLEARGPAPGLSGALEVTATSEADGEIRGTVRNRLETTLHSVVAFSGRAAAVEIGTLGPGEEKPYALEGTNAFVWGATPETEVWPSDTMEFGESGECLMTVLPDGGVVEECSSSSEALVAVDDGDQDAGGADGDGGEPPVVLAAWGETITRTGSNFRPPGQVVVAGWTDDIAAPATPTGGPADRTTSAIVARATPTPVGDRLTDSGTVRSIVRGPATQQPADVPEADATGGIGFVSAFDLPERVGGRPVDVDRLVVNVADLFITFDFWTPGGWVAIDPPTIGQEEHRVPPEAVVGGTVYVRITAPTNAVPNPGRDLGIYERELRS
ncbi:MAG: hypothetical protein ACRDZN_12310 [Acidimicrobiales bacterium]